MKKALLIIDVQNDYFPGGKNELFEADKALEVIKKLIAKFRGNDEPIYYIQHISAPTAKFFVPGSQGCEIHEAIKPRENDKVIVKHRPSSFLGTNLQEELQKDGTTELVVCGMMTHMCVDTTVRAAQDYNYKVTLISDGCATKDLERNGNTIPASVVQETYLASLQGMFATVMTGEEYLKEQ